MTTTLAEAAQWAETPELVIIDLDGGDRTAARVATLRTAFGSGEEIPVLGITSDVTTAGRTRCAALGVHDFATRPLGREELRMRVDNALGAGRLRRLLGQRSAHLFFFIV